MNLQTFFYLVSGEGEVLRIASKGQERADQAARGLEAGAFGTSRRKGHRRSSVEAFQNVSQLELPTKPKFLTLHPVPAVLSVRPSLASTLS